MELALRTEIATVPVADLARRFGTPTYVYDAAMMLRRLGDLAGFDHVRYAQKACSNLAVLDLLRRHGALVDAVSAGELRRALAAGYAVEGVPPPIVYTADIFDAEALDLCVERGIHVNCGSPDMIDQLGSRAPGRRITLRINPGFGHGHSRKTNTGGEAVETRHLARADRRLPRPRRALRAGRRRAAHAHRLRHGPGTPVARLRGHGEGGRAPSGPASARSAPAADCPSPIAPATATSIWPPISPSGPPPGSGSPSGSDTRSAWKSSPADTWSRRAATWSRRFGR